MSNEIKIIYIDGKEEIYCGGISVSAESGIVNIFPCNERLSVNIPLVQIKKYEVR